ncbi:MAG: CotH kinase family protein, partial [bacterium]
MVSKNSFKHISLLLILFFGFWIISALGSRVLMANPGNVINEIVTAGDTDPITSVSSFHAVQGASNVMVTITLNEMMQMLFPDINPISVKIGTLEGSNINRNGLEITAVFDIPVNEPLGMKEVSVEFPAPPMDPNAQPMSLSEPGAFEILRSNIPFNIGSTSLDEVVTDIPIFTPGGLYDETILRTISLEFDQNDWWQQLERNFDTERNILADLTMDGIIYPDVGVRFKGMTSYMMGMNTRKKSFNITIDEINPDQRLMGYKTLNLHNGSQDPSFIREVIYFSIFRQYAPCPQANFVKLVINGEDWGIYVNVQQNNAELVEEWFGRNDGDRWKVGMGNMGGGFFIDGNIAQIPYSDWINSPMAADLNDDGQIDEEDYDIFLDSQWNTGGGWWAPDPNMTTGGFWGGVDPVADWLASSEAQDLNDDGEITGEDYFIFINSPPTGGWGSDPNIPFI